MPGQAEIRLRPAIVPRSESRASLYLCQLDAARFSLIHLFTSESPRSAGQYFAPSKNCFLGTARVREQEVCDLVGCHHCWAKEPLVLSRCH